MPAWVAPLAAAAFFVLVLNVAWLVQRRRAAQGWERRFLHELRRWDGRVPDDLERHQPR